MDKCTTSSDPVVERLRQVAQASPDLREAAQIYEAMLPLVRDADLRVAAGSLTSDEVRAKMEKGRPLLAGLDVGFDIEAVRNLMRDCSRAIGSKGNGTGSTRTEAGKIGRALENGSLDVVALLQHAAANDHEQIEQISAGLGLDPDLVLMLVHNALKPVLHELRRRLAPLAVGADWEPGGCYVCGARAAFGELRENEQAKRLRCASCGADWRHPRIKCARCGNDDHRTLRYLFREDEERTRVEACDRCKGYLKIIFSFSPTPPELVAVEDLATLHLDFVAQKEGYHNGSESFVRGDDAGLRPAFGVNSHV